MDFLQQGYLQKYFRIFTNSFVIIWKLPYILGKIFDIFTENKTF